MNREAMKLALEALIFNQANWQGKDKAITALKQALEQPEPEPVAYQDIAEKCRLETVPAKGTLLHTSPPKREPPCKTGSQCTTKCMECTEPEPVECHTCKGLGRIYMGCGSWIHCDTCNTTGKATTQPKREWQGLTDEEIDEGQRQSWVDKQAFESAVWWAEAKLKEKNT